MPARRWAQPHTEPCFKALINTCTAEVSGTRLETLQSCQIGKVGHLWGVSPQKTATSRLTTLEILFRLPSIISSLVHDRAAQCQGSRRDFLKAPCGSKTNPLLQQMLKNTRMQISLICLLRAWSKTAENVPKPHQVPRRPLCIITNPNTISRQ